MQQQHIELFFIVLFYSQGASEDERSKEQQRHADSNQTDILK